jgi:hypothetical protein
MGHGKANDKDLGMKSSGPTANADQQNKDDSDLSTRHGIATGHLVPYVEQTQVPKSITMIAAPQPGRTNDKEFVGPSNNPYHALGPDTIRLIIVHPGTSTQDLECSLIERPLSRLDSKGRPILNSESKVKLEPYDALSYSWDRQIPSHPIRIRKDGGGYNNFLVTDNLKYALQNLRHISNERRFWVDAICINQTSHSDKNQQLPLMARIYTEADNVSVWLGREDATTAAAFRLMKKIRVLEDFDVVVERNTTCEEWVAFHTLIKRSWFSRRWVVQEITMARNATIHCGTCTIGWKDFAGSIGLFELMAERVKVKFRQAGEYEHNPDMFGETRQYSAHLLVDVTSNVVSTGDDGQVVERRWSLESLVSGLTSFEAGSGHDIIYALLSLAKNVRGSSSHAPTEFRPLKPSDLPPQMRIELEAKGTDLRGHVNSSIWFALG